MTSPMTSQYTSIKCMLAELGVEKSPATALLIGANRAAHDSPTIPASPAGFLESGRGYRGGDSPLKLNRQRLALHRRR
jgi:hypothetical protein